MVPDIIIKEVIPNDIVAMIRIQESLIPGLRVVHCRRGIGSLFSLLLVLGGLLCAQDTRSVHGVVLDAQGRAVAGAAVQLEDVRTQQIRSFLTKKDGTYYFEDLGSDSDYTLRARYQTVWSDQKNLTKFQSGKSIEIDLKFPRQRLY